MAETPQMDDNRRRYVRVSADCPVMYRVVDPHKPGGCDINSIDPLASLPALDVTSHVFGLGESANHQMMELLLWLDWKVNYLIKTLAQKESRELFPLQAMMVDLSVSGMRFSTSEAAPLGTRLQIKFIVPVLPFKEMILDADVMRCSKAPIETLSHEFEVAVEFKEMKESDQEYLFRYVVKREMQIQRERGVEA